MRVLSCGITDIGLKRERNEDSFLINEELDLYVLCDGMGGHAGGEYASAIAVNVVEEVMASIEVHGDVDPEDDPVELTRRRIDYAVRLASERIHETAQREPELQSMGTTVVVLHVRDGNAYIAHVGDSRLYRLREGHFEQLTDDHSFVGRGIREGLLTEEEARNHPLRNVITRSLGSQPTVEVDIQVRAIRRGDRYLLCSDGLSGFVEDGDIERVLAEQRPRAAARELVGMACDRGGEDNITIIVAVVEDE